MTKNKDDKHTQSNIREKDVKDLSDKTRISASIFADKKGEYLITKEEILSGNIMPNHLLIKLKNRKYFHKKE